MKKLILHIGLHKTGTTYLQRLLIENREVLTSHAVGLADHVNEVTGHHHLLVKALRENDSAKFIRAIDDCPQPNVIVSSEALTHWLQREPEAEAFCHRLSERYSLTVVLFLRRQDFLKESVFSEVATKWYSGTIQDENHYQYDFEILLKRLEQLFSRPQLRIRVYRDDVTNTLLSAFMDAAELDIPNDKFQEPPPQRVSLNRRKVFLLSKVPKRQPNYQQIFQAVRASKSLKHDGYKYLLSPAERKQFLAQFIDSNRRISERYNLDCGDYLYSTQGIDDRWKSIKPLPYADCAVLLGDMTKEPS